jgi:hypothetical protein
MVTPVVSSNSSLIKCGYWNTLKTIWIIVNLAFILEKFICPKKLLQGPL